MGMEQENRSEPVDLLIVGGGINGAGIARDAAGRGLSVLLCEQWDLGGATSSVTSKLLHGGLRYLEQRRFRMVRQALAEREVLLRNAPHIVRPLRFVLPQNERLRPSWQVRAGLFLYDHLARRQTLPASERLDLKSDPAGKSLVSSLAEGFAYSDCWVDDARLVILNALDAKDRGATVLPRTGCVAAERDEEFWTATLLDMTSGNEQTVRARAIVNAAGPWAGEVLRDVLHLEPGYTQRLVKGSHIVVRKWYEGEHAYILQNDDRRVVFVIPFEGEFVIVGTTDVPFDDEPGPVEIDQDEIDYLCATLNRCFEQQVTADDVIWSYSGLRPLYDDGSASESGITRDYALELTAGDGGAPALTVWGGKLTGYRLLAEAVLDRLEKYLPVFDPVWTASTPLPGGGLQSPGIERFQQIVRQTWPWLPPELATAYVRRYGARVHKLMGNAGRFEAMGAELSPGLYEREARFLVRYEWATTAEDILWRRTKLGLHAGPDDAANVEAFLASEFGF